MKKKDGSEHKIKKICLLTGGGDAPGLNAVIHAIVTKAVNRYNLEVWGSEDGFEGLIQPPSAKKVRRLTPEDVKEIIHIGGSILGCSNKANPWYYPIIKNGEEILVDKHKTLLKHINEYGFDALILIGGDGTMHIAKRLKDLGIKVVGVPKTIDNDLASTDYTFGFYSAVNTATWALDNLRTTAHAHDRVIILEVMGRYTGWIALEAGLAGRADVILIPEIPYDPERVIKKINSLGGKYNSFGLIVIAEGARPIGGEVSIDREGKPGHLPHLGGAGERLKKQLEGRIKHDIRVVVLGHLQRGGNPSPFDRVLGLRLGAKAVELIMEGKFGYMVCLHTPSISEVPIEEVINNQKKVDPEGEMVRLAKELGIELGAP